MISPLFKVFGLGNSRGVPAFRLEALFGREFVFSSNRLFLVPDRVA